jgi:hypothetical protein
LCLYTEKCIFISTTCNNTQEVFNLNAVNITTTSDYEASLSSDCYI